MYSLSANQRAGLGAGEVTASTMHSGGGADPQVHFLVGLYPWKLCMPPTIYIMLLTLG